MYERGYIKSYNRDVENVNLNSNDPGIVLICGAAFIDIIVSSVIQAQCSLSNEKVSKG